LGEVILAARGINAARRACAAAKRGGPGGKPLPMTTRRACRLPPPRRGVRHDAGVAARFGAPGCATSNRRPARCRTASAGRPTQRLTGRGR